MTFDDFRQQHGGQDRGLHQAAGKTLRDYYKDCEQQGRFPKSIKNDENEKYRWIFEKIDKAIHSNGSFRRKIVTENRQAKTTAFYNLINDWIGKKPENRTSKPPSAMQETEPLMVYYYFAYLHKDVGHTQNKSFAILLESFLKKSGEVAKLREQLKNKKIEASISELNSKPGHPTPVSVTPLDSQHKNPKTSLWIIEPTDETRFLYRSRSIPFIGAEEPFKQLNCFIKEPAPFLWHVIHGPGGTGKSRLALEYALQLENEKIWHAGFIDMVDAETFDWHKWKPEQPCFLIIDYAARASNLVAEIIRSLSMRDDLKYPVRLLMLERDINGAWFNRITWRGHQESTLTDQSWSGLNGELEPPDDVWPIIQHMCHKIPERLPDREKALAELERLDTQMRPLFAAFLGDAYLRQENPRNWDSYALVENVLEHEKRYWEAGYINHQHINLCASATSTGGIPGEWLVEFSQTIMRGFWPQWQGNQTLDTLSAIYGDTLIDDIPPLEPDILGEIFFLEQWKSASRHERNHLLQYGTMLAPWFASFLERLISDFPNLDTSNLLKTVLAADFGEYSNSKSELLYNVITATAKTHPALAIEIYKLFPTFKTPGHEDYQNECFLDACHNLIVGIPEIEEAEAFEIYGLQKANVEQTSVILDRVRSGTGMSLIGRFPLANSQKFRTILADTIKAHRRHPDDESIRQDTSIAIANYVNLLDITQIKHAKNMLQLFRHIANENHEDDMEDAWGFILYHMFLLLMLEANEAAVINETTKSTTLEQLIALAPETSRYEKRILQLLKDDME